MLNMKKDASRRAKVTPETKAESARLAKIWAAKPHPSQAEFGETYSIGNQSAVGQFLRGEVPLSLKAASGFAKGLGCRIEDFSQRLAAEAASLVQSRSTESISAELADLATAVEGLPKKQRDWVLMTLREAVKLAKELADGDNSAANSSGLSDSASSKRAA